MPNWVFVQEVKVNLFLVKILETELITDLHYLPELQIIILWWEILMTVVIHFIIEPIFTALGITH